MLIGAFWGALFGFVAHWASRGARDFSSVQALQAASYQVQVASSSATQAAGIIGRL